MPGEACDDRRRRPWQSSDGDAAALESPERRNQALFIMQTSRFCVGVNTTITALAGRHALATFAGNHCLQTVTLLFQAGRFVLIGGVGALATWRRHRGGSGPDRADAGSAECCRCTGRWRPRASCPCCRHHLSAGRGAHPTLHLSCGTTSRGRAQEPPVQLIPSYLVCSGLAPRDAPSDGERPLPQWPLTRSAFLGHPRILWRPRRR